MMEIIAVFGVSGVGKSTLINSFIELNPSWAHLQAGDLIRTELKNVDRDKLRLKGNEAILKNQYLMIDAFWKEVEAKNLSKIIFDGHSIIDTGDGVVEIPVEVIKAIKPTKILFIQVDGEIVLNRRSQDSSRDRPILSKEQIEVQQEYALKQADMYSKALSIPISIITNPEIEELCKQI